MSGNSVTLSSVLSGTSNNYMNRHPEFSTGCFKTNLINECYIHSKSKVKYTRSSLKQERITDSTYVLIVLKLLYLIQRTSFKLKEKINQGNVLRFSMRLFVQKRTILFLNHTASIKFTIFV